MKKCNYCKRDLSLSFYGKDKYTRDGYSNRCKGCKRLIRDKKSGRSSRNNVVNLTEASRWLEDNYPRFSIVKWGGNASSISVIRDIEREVDFKYSFSRFRDKIQKNPTRTFAPTKQELSEKVRESFKKKYGKECALQIERFKKKAVETTKKRYGASNIMQSEKFKKENGVVKLIEGKTIKEWADDLGISYSHFRNVMAYEGLDIAKNLKQHKTNLESSIELLLKKNGIDFSYNEWISSLKIRPDFLIPESDLVIECNGFRWHSDEFIKDKKFHQRRLNKLESIGLQSLFFTTEEIKNKLPIVESIILNKLGKSERIYARKCKIKVVEAEEAKKFFEDNHLMGNGSGRTYGMYYKEKLVMAIQVRWKHKKEKLLDLSRVCPQQKTLVVGGFSKLIEYIKKEERPNKIQTFIDRRYGSGKYLTKLGFQKTSESLSFCWTDGQKSYHRMKYPGNLGYEYGLFKIWDCGQAKWEFVHS